jgi:hypothetical protein
MCTSSGVVALEFDSPWLTMSGPSFGLKLASRFHMPIVGEEPRGKGIAEFPWPPFLVNMNIIPHTSNNLFKTFKVFGVEFL